ncbi:MAG: MarR family winged helix-turn-helix transcriptional regulator [Acidimicrobiales bacterium]
MSVEREDASAAGGRGLSIARIAAWLARQAELALAESDLSLPQFRVLHLLADGIALPSSMADTLDVRRPSITAVVDGLVARALVVREHDAEDRRRVTHSITKEGRHVLEAADRAVEERLCSIAGTLEDEDLAARAIDGLARWGPALIEWRNQKRRQQVTS